MAHRILLAEDDAFIGQVYESFLVEAGYEVITARNGREALEHMKTSAPTLVVLDLLMPEVSGMDVLKARKNDEALSRIPVLVLTGVEDAETVSTVRTLGANDYFDKNTTELEPLLEKIRQLTGA